MKPGPALRRAVMWTHDQAASDDVPAWAGEGFAWTIPPMSYTSRAMRLMEWRGGRQAIPRSHRRVAHTIRRRLEAQR